MRSFPIFALSLIFGSCVTDSTIVAGCDRYKDLQVSQQRSEKQILALIEQARKETNQIEQVRAGLQRKR